MNKKYDKPSVYFIIVVIYFLIFYGGIQKCRGQGYPQIEEFNAGTTWSYTNGAGLQNYGGAENYATFNIGTTPYPNSSFITITSPIIDVSDCNSGLTVSFPLSGRIENGWDFMRFQYFNAGVWNTLGTYTGIQNSTPSFPIPNTTTQLRFTLTTDATVNTYLTCCPFTNNVYYYDITRVTISCTSILPIELVSFDCYPIDNNIELRWITSNELNCREFKVLKSQDFNIWDILGTVQCLNKPHTYVLRHFNPIEGLWYYKLQQSDYNGSNKEFEAIACNSSKFNEIIEFYNIIGQKIDYEPVNQIYIKKIIKGDNVKYLKSIKYDE